MPSSASVAVNQGAEKSQAGRKDSQNQKEGVKVEGSTLIDMMDQILKDSQKGQMEVQDAIIAAK